MHESVLICECFRLIIGSADWARMPYCNGINDSNLIAVSAEKSRPELIEPPATLR